MSNSLAIPAGTTQISTGNYKLDFDVCATDQVNGGAEFCSKYYLNYKDCGSMLAFASGYAVKRDDGSALIDPITDGSKTVFNLNIGLDTKNTVWQF